MKDPRGFWHEETHGVGITQALDLAPVHAETSDFQRIEVFDHAAFGRVLALDGTVQLSLADEFIYHEMAVHVPLLGRRRAAARVLIIGGGDGGILREVLRHDFVREVVMVEIDRRVVEVSNELVGVQGDYDDPRVTLLIDDGIKYMADSARAGRRFDVVIIDATDSTSPSKALWTETFYASVAACLADDGVALDSDILVPGRGGPRFSREPCDVGMFDLVRGGPFAGVDCFHAKVPLYPGGLFAFFLYTKDGHSHREPFREHVGRYYNPAAHRGAFALPTWWRDLMDGLRPASRVSDQVLQALGRLGPSGWGRLVDSQDGTLGEFHAALDAHRAAGRVSLEAGVASLTPAGRAALGARGASPAYDLACGDCDARGYRVEAGDARLARLHELLRDRPGPRMEFDQGAITPGDALLRASFIEDRGDLTGRSLLMIGDFDLVSLALVMTGKPERVVVLDIDERIVEFVNRAAAREGFPLEARRLDVRSPLPADLERRFDAFHCDPVETLAGARLFLSRGAAGLRGAGSAVYVGLTTIEASRKKWFDIQGVLHEMGFAITDARRRFSGYPDHDEAPRDPAYVYPIVEAMGTGGIEHRWYTASFLRGEAVRVPEPAVRGEVALGDDLYVDDEAWATPRAPR